MNTYRVRSSRIIHEHRLCEVTQSADRARWPVPFVQAGLPSMEECLHRAESMEHQTDAVSIRTCVGFYLLSTEPERGLRLGLQYVKGKIPTVLRGLNGTRLIQTVYDILLPAGYTIGL